VWRRRVCVACGAVFTSTESVDYPKSLILEMPDASLRPFTKEKLFLSMYKSCEHRKSAVDDAAALTDTVISKIVRTGTKSVVPASQLANLVYETLKNFDSASAVQFAAYHAEYKL
jgi:transcriptional regulator NrdR family protein